jgi:hypothetical protein
MPKKFTWSDYGLDRADAPGSADAAAKGTLRAHCEKYLTDNGMWPIEAIAVMDGVVSNPAMEFMSVKGRWDEPIEDYKEGPILRILMVLIKDSAVDWIDANKPKHWAREMFVRDSG